MLEEPVEWSVAADPPEEDVIDRTFPRDPASAKAAAVVVVAFAIFMVIKAINKMHKPAEAAPAAPPEPAEDVLLLREIRDSLKK